MGPSEAAIFMKKMRRGGDIMVIMVAERNDVTMLMMS